MGIQGMAYPRTALVEWTIGLQRIRVTVDITVDMRVSDVPKCLINQHLVLGFNVCRVFTITWKNGRQPSTDLESIDLQIKSVLI